MPTLWSWFFKNVVTLKGALNVVKTTRPKTEQKHVNETHHAADVRANTRKITEVVLNINTCPAFQAPVRLNPSKQHKIHLIP